MYVFVWWCQNIISYHGWWPQGLRMKVTVPYNFIHQNHPCGVFLIPEDPGPESPVWWPMHIKLWNCGQCKVWPLFFLPPLCTTIYRSGQSCTWSTCTLYITIKTGARLWACDEKTTSISWMTMQFLAICSDFTPLVAWIHRTCFLLKSTKACLKLNRSYITVETTLNMALSGKSCVQWRWQV